MYLENRKFSKMQHDGLKMELNRIRVKYNELLYLLDSGDAKYTFTHGNYYLRCEAYKDINLKTQVLIRIYHIKKYKRTNGTNKKFINNLFFLKDNILESTYQARCNLSFSHDKIIGLTRKATKKVFDCVMYERIKQNEN